MVFISNVIPAFEVRGDISKEITTMLSLNKEESLMYFKIRVIDSREIQKAIDQGFSIGYCVRGLQGFNLKQISCIIEENEQLKSQLERLKSCYSSLSKEIFNMKSSSNAG